MPRYGIKVWSKDVLKNPDFFNEAAEAVKNGTFGYIELFAIPDSFNETQSLIAPAIKGSRRSLPERNNPPVPQYRRQPDCRRKPSVNMLVNTCAPPWQHTG